MANHCDTIKLEKGMYQEAGRSFTQVLERLDPSEQYKGTGMEGLDAFQRQLKRFDIKVRGTASDPVEKFFRTANSAVLFPEYIARSVRQGMEEGDLLPSITAATTRFEGMDYRSITAQAGGDSKELKAVDEGASIPATTIQVQANLVKLRKRGRMLVASYEAVRYQKLDLFSVTLRQIGSHIAQMLLADAVDVLIHGDGNDNAAAASETKGAGVLTYDELVDFWAAFDPYEMNTLLVSSDVLLKMLKLAAFLREQGLQAMTDWPVEPRELLDGPVAVVSLQGCRAGPAGFQHYLGERYDREREQWVEVYGQKVQLTFGLDLYAPPQLGEAAMQAALDQLAGACAGAGPVGLDIREFSCGETGYDRDSRLLKRPAQAVCTACLYAVTEPSGTFLDFEVRGESHQ